METGFDLPDKIEVAGLRVLTTIAMASVIDDRQRLFAVFLVHEIRDVGQSLLSGIVWLQTGFGNFETIVFLEHLTELVDLRQGQLYSTG